MLRLNFQRIHTYFLRTLKHSHLDARYPTSIIVEHPASISLWKRLVGQYQFRTSKSSYYPDRKSEMQRSHGKGNTQTRAQVANATKTAVATPLDELGKKGLPKDFYYKVLGVTRYATLQQIRTAFYSLAKRYHPDSTHSEQKLKHFQELSNAYNILTDETKRLEYDQLGGIKDERAFLEQAGNPMTTDSNLKFDAQKQTNEEIDKITKPELELPLAFLEATVGCKKRLDLRYLRKCDSCKGKSQLMANREVGKEPCRRCNGTGKISKKTLTYTSVNTCTHCKGKRYINRNDCETCDNRGFVLANVEVLINVPSGSQDGDVITIDNPNTKQHVNYRLKVPSSDYFRRIGNDVHTDKYLTISEAILGGNFTVRGLYENIEVRVEPGTQSHTQLLLKSKGVRSNGCVGNHIITLKVRIPRNLSMKQRQLVLAMAKAEEPVFDCQKGNQE
ncbi:uncharacterized protein LOC115633134 [Scaptodrosophila lebanonensis]|uniref:Uncharacterized protein LOC115633134 n=1 Tax=Drosophila lebanonensis TaxID=7225 RepID=A0A6J2UD37_DROLE|nr:uncharacterized protein LOC115633134 [Scaptodrosophila lebanonensis]